MVSLADNISLYVLPGGMPTGRRLPKAQNKQRWKAMESGSDKICRCVQVGDAIRELHESVAGCHRSFMSPIALSSLQFLLVLLLQVSVPMPKSLGTS